MPSGPPREFSRRLPVERIGSTPVAERIEASEAERGNLAARLGLVGLRELAADLELVRRPGGLIRLTGNLRAEVEQTCVVTIETFAAHVEESFELFFAERPDERAADLDIDPLDDEAWPEPVENSAIDLGEAVAQQLSLALDPHPRAPGAELDRASAGDDGKENPFRGLAARMGRSKREQ